MGLKDSEVSLYKLKEMKDNKALFTDEDDMILFLDTQKRPTELHRLQGFCFIMGWGLNAGES